MQKVNKTTLKNGVRIITKSMPYVHSVTMGVWVNVGTRDEAPPQNGLSHFIEHMIFKGTDKRTAYEIAKQFDAIGGQTNAFTSMEHTCYHAKVMDSQVKTMVDVLGDIFLNSTFAPDEVEKERPVIFQEIGMVEDNPEEYVHVLSGKNFWGDHPLGQSILGTRENILKFDASTIKTFFRSFYQPDQIVISVAGNVDHDHFVDLVGPSFETIKQRDSVSRRVSPQCHGTVTLHEKPLEQAHICLLTNGLSTDDPKRFALSLLNSIMGGNMSSRLFQEIREKRGLAYSIYSYICSHADAGMFGIYTGVDPKSVPQSTQLILDEIGRLKSVAVHPDELTDAKEFTKGNLYLASESPDNQMFRLAQNELRFGRNIPLQELVDCVCAVTPDEILALAQEIFRPDHLSLTILGNVSDAAAYEDMLYGCSQRKTSYA